MLENQFISRLLLGHLEIIEAPYASEYLPYGKLWVQAEGMCKICRFLKY